MNDKQTIIFPSKLSQPLMTDEDLCEKLPPAPEPFVIAVSKKRKSVNIKSVLKRIFKMSKSQTKEINVCSQV